MQSRNSYHGLHPTVSRAIKYQACWLKRLACFADHDLEDIEQELLLLIWLSLAKYDQKRSNFKTYVNRIVNSRSRTLIRKQICSKRAGSLQTPILFLEQEDNTGHTLLDSLATDCGYADTEMRLDLDKTIAQMPEHLRTLCILLKIFTVGEVAKMIGKSRATIYRELGLMRSRFTSLENYIKKPRTFRG